MRFITKISLNKNIDRSIYPFNLPVLKNFEELTLNSSVTFFVGENGSGKSTMVEGIAVASGLNAEGGTNNFNFKTSSSHSTLYKELIISKTGNRPETKFFLRAESFYNVISEIDHLDEARGGGNPIRLSYGGKYYIFARMVNHFWI